MTVIVDVAFPFGFVHVTPWGTHVNEGAIEWPPSPWRLLRALVATWHTRCPDLSGEEVQPVLDALAPPPAVRVAPRTEASIRTYLPAEGHRSGLSRPDVDLAVDAFAAVPHGTGASYRWDVELDGPAQTVLSRLVEALPYLGRAESVCEASARFEDSDGGWVLPMPDTDGIGTRVLVPDVPLDLDALCVSIRAMRKQGRLRPPGAHWIRYPVPAPVTGGRRIGRLPGQAVTAVRLALGGIGAAARRAVPIPVRQTVVVAESVRAAAMSQFGRLAGGGASATFAGKSADGTPLRGNRHAHWLPLDLDGDRLIDTVVVWAPGGLDDIEVAALAAIERLWFHEGDGLSIQGVALAVEAVGDLDDLQLRDVARPSRRWVSATPFLPQRHRKRETLEDFLMDCVRRELSARGVDTPFTLSRETRTSWGSFRRYRRAERLARARSGFGLQVVFDEPVTGPEGGPLCIGALAHYGMGRFVAAD